MFGSRRVARRTPVEARGECPARRRRLHRQRAATRPCCRWRPPAGSAGRGRRAAGGAFLASGSRRLAAGRAGARRLRQRGCRLFPARWTAPDGRARTGQIPVSARSAAGHVVPLWVDAAGSPAGPPLNPVWWRPARPPSAPSGPSASGRAASVVRLKHHCSKSDCPARQFRMTDESVMGLFLVRFPQVCGQAGSAAPLGDPHRARRPETSWAHGLGHVIRRERRVPPAGRGPAPQGAGTDRLRPRAHRQGAHRRQGSGGRP